MPCPDLLSLMDVEERCSESSSMHPIWKSALHIIMVKTFINIQASYLTADSRGYFGQFSSQLDYRLVSYNRKTFIGN